MIIEQFYWHFYNLLIFRNSKLVQSWMPRIVYAEITLPSTYHLRRSQWRWLFAASTSWVRNWFIQQWLRQKNSPKRPFCALWGCLSIMSHDRVWNKAEKCYQSLCTPFSAPHSQCFLFGSQRLWTHFCVTWFVVPLNPTWLDLAKKSVTEKKKHENIHWRSNCAIRDYTFFLSPW